MADAVYTLSTGTYVHMYRESGTTEHILAGRTVPLSGGPEESLGP